MTFSFAKLLLLVIQLQIKKKVENENEISKMQVTKIAFQKTEQQNWKLFFAQILLSAEMEICASLLFRFCV